MRILLCLAAAVVVLVLAPAQSMAAIASEGHIENGTVQLGVRPDGALNVYNVDSFGDYFGLRYLPTGNEASSAVSHACEGWGVADSGTQSSGYTNFGCDDGSPNTRVESFTRTATTAVSTVLVCENDGDPLVCKTADSSILRVTHDLHPSPATPNLYEVTVTIANVSTHTVTPFYRRVIDWQIEPDTNSEALTMSASPLLYRMSNDGYSSANPLSEPLGGCGSHDPPDEPCVDQYQEFSWGGAFTTTSPTDQGSLFDLALPSLVPGASLTFPLYLGAAGSKADALTARTSVNADAYALALPAGQPSTGTPNTFILAFRVASVTVTEPPAPPPTPSTNPPRSATSPVRRTRTPPTPRAKPLRFEVLKHRFRRNVLELTLRCSAECNVRATGTIFLFRSTGKKSLKLRKGERKLRANVKSKVKLRLRKSAKRALRRARGKKLLNARLSLTATDGQGKRVKRKPAFPL